jgi:hypothetical protein
MTKKELESLVRQLTEQNAAMTRMLTAMQMEIKARKCNDITDVKPKIYPQPYSPTTAPLPRWWEQAMCGTNLAN